MKRAIAIALLVAGSSYGAHAATVVVSNCESGSLGNPDAWQAGQWQGLYGAFMRTEDSPFWGAPSPCSVVAGEFDDFEDFASWWTADLGRELSEILNVAYVQAAEWLPNTAETNPAALIFLQGVGAPISVVSDPFDPYAVPVVIEDLQSLYDLFYPAMFIAIELAPTSALPVPEPGSLLLVGSALAFQISWASRRSRAEAARRSGRARSSALRAALVKRPSS